jgi:hypothetical protein
MNLITDKKLSCAQRIIMMYLRSLDTPEWTGKLVELAVPIGISESAVCTDTIRLAELGYLRRERISKNAGTRLSGFESIGKPQSFKKGGKNIPEPDLLPTKFETFAIESNKGKTGIH